MHEDYALELIDRSGAPTAPAGYSFTDHAIFGGFGGIFLVMLFIFFRNWEKYFD